MTQADSGRPSADRLPDHERNVGTFSEVPSGTTVVTRTPLLSPHFKGIWRLLQTATIHVGRFSILPDSVERNSNEVNSVI